MENLYKNFADELEERKLAKAWLPRGKEHEAGMIRKQSKSKKLSDDERHDMSHNLAMHDLKQYTKLDHATLSDRLNGHGAKSDMLQDKLNDFHNNHKEKSDTELTAAHGKLDKRN